MVVLPRVDVPLLSRLPLLLQAIVPLLADDLLLPLEVFQVGVVFALSGFDFLLGFGPVLFEEVGGLVLELLLVDFVVGVVFGEEDVDGRLVFLLLDVNFPNQSVFLDLVDLLFVQIIVQILFLEHPDFLFIEFLEEVSDAIEPVFEGELFADRVEVQLGVVLVRTP
jgi:hypothetical protein